MAISILAARDLSLASISSKVSDDSLLRLVARIGCRVSLALPTSMISRLVGPMLQHAYAAYDAMGIGQPAPPCVTNLEQGSMVGVYVSSTGN